MPDPNVSLDDYRKLDQQEAVNVDQELMPEKQTLNVRYVSDFLNKKGITAENFDKNFTLATAIELTASKHSKGEAAMFDVLSKTKSFLDQRNLGGIVENMNDSTVNSNIHFELDKRKEPQHEADLKRGYYTYRAVKMYCDRIFKIHEQFAGNREQEKTKVEKGVKEEFASVMEDVKKNFGSLDGKEKMLVVVGGLIGAAMLMGSDSPRVDKLKETIWTCMKIGGVAWLGNTVFKVFTGKSAIDTVSDWSKSNVATEAFWTKTFKTNAEQAEILRKSTIYLGDMDFMRLAGEYTKARNMGKNRIELPTIGSQDMTPEQIYTSLDVFFKRYPVENCMKKYAQWKKPDRPTWREVVGNELIDDQSIQMSDSVASQIVDTVHSTVTKGYNLVAPPVAAAADYVSSGRMVEGAARGGEAAGKFVGEVGRGAGKGVKGLAIGVAAGVGGVAKGVYEGAKGVGGVALEGGQEVAGDLSEAAQATWAWAKETYHKNFGKEGTDDQVLEWSQKTLKNWDESQSGDLDKFIHENNPERKKADGYVDAMRNGKFERVNDVDVKYIERDKGTSTASIYIAAGYTIPAGEKGVTQQSVLDAMRKSDAGARDFLKKKYPELADKIDTFVDFSQGIYVANERSYKVLIRMPLPGTVEFNQRSTGRWTPEEMKKRKDIETFGPDNKLEYSKLEKWEQNTLRLRFYLDSSQTPELEAICDKYTRMYNTKGLPIDVVRKRFMENDEDRDFVMSQLRLDRKLYNNRGILEGKESDIASLEADAAADVVGSDDSKKEFLVTIHKSIGARVRLALLGDQESMTSYNYDPQSNDKTKLRSADDLLKVYKDDLNKSVKKRNGNS